ncbi:hypothetical protein RB195_017336 [Necator americanus]|uniref:Serpentine receptor class gamma n=1 Tax=Necator americanus TaxID=51031 RepID=A0ABR1C795_NECAM
MLMLSTRLGYCIPSIVLYIVVTVLLYKERRRLFGSFYFLFLTQAITNIFVFTNSLYVVQLANETNESSWWKFIYTEAPEFIVRITGCLGNHFAFVQTYMTLFISINRMTFIVSPGADEKIWKIVAPVCVAIAYLSPFIATYSHLTNKASWKFRPESRCFVSFSEASLIFTSPYIGIDSSVSLALIPYASDILTLSNPYLLIALNRSIRSRLFRLLKCKNTVPS